MGKVKALIPLFLAIAVALFATLLIYRWVLNKTIPSSSNVASELNVNVVVARSDIPWGTKLSSEMLKAVALPKQALPVGHFSDSTLLVGRVLVASLKENEPIIETKLAPTSVKTGGVCAVVKPGKRALAVAGDKVIGLAGFIQPENRVDILVTLKPHENEKDPVTKVVLEDVLVLATGNQIQNNPDGKPAPVDVFTVEVSPEEGERLSLAATQGKLHFALRNITDREIVYTVGCTIADALDAYRPRLQTVREPVVQQSSQLKEEPRRTGREVQTIRGNKVSAQTF
jgi:pilus assembly protein CpaB